MGLEKLGEGLPQDGDLGEVRVGREPEAAEEVLQEGVVGLAGVGLLHVVEAAEGLCLWCCCCESRVWVWVCLKKNERKKRLSTKEGGRVAYQHGEAHGHEVLWLADLGALELDLGPGDFVGA